MSKILEEFEDINSKKSSQNTFFYIKIFTLVVIVAGFGIYVGDLLFGKSSLDVLLNLQTDRDNLGQKVINLKHENALLQKEYFELKDLDPDSKGRQ